MVHIVIRHIYKCLLQQRDKKTVPCAPAQEDRHIKMSHLNMTWSHNPRFFSVQPATLFTHFGGNWVLLEVKKLCPPACTQHNDSFKAMAASWHVRAVTVEQIKVK